jgi:isoquinoline 1-oxidoreductase subunit beta
MNAPSKTSDLVKVGPALSRRMMLGAGSGLVLALSLPARAAEAPKKYGRDAQEEGWRDDPRLFVALAPDGTVTITCHRSEMGQGIRSSLAMVIADEMEADWSRIRIEQAVGAAERYGNQNTDGSRSMRHWLLPMRRGGAALRMMLVEAAARDLGVPAAELQAKGHKVIHARSGRTVDYGKLAPLAAKLAVPPRELVVLKDAAALTMIGTEGVRSADAVAMTTGKAVYGIDATMPDMVFACVARPPVLGAKIARYDATAAKAVPGVIDVVELPIAASPAGFQPRGGIAVIAKNSWIAMKGRDALVVEWTDAPNAQYDSAAYRAQSLETVRKPAQVIRNEGDFDAAIKSAKKRVTAEYVTPHIAHATMEPPAAVVRFDGTNCEAIACVQDSGGTRDVLAQMLKLDKAKVTVHQTLLGGGFGRKSKPDFVVEAAWLSKAQKGRPVKIVWSREDDIRNDYYHTTTIQRLEAGLDSKGAPTAWLHRNVAPSIVSIFADGIDREQQFEVEMGLLNMPFAIPNVRVENGEAKAHTRIGWFRSVDNIPHAFAVQSFAAELAHAAGQDQKDYLLRLLGPDRKIDMAAWKDSNSAEDPELYPFDTGRLRRVLEAAAAGIGWDKQRKGWGYGIACHRSFMSYTAVAFAVSVAKGQLAIHKADIAIDCGAAINPDRIRSQMEGAVMMGLSLALMGEISFSKGAVEQGSFDDYPVLRIEQAPRELAIHIVGADLNVPPGGVGEPGCPPVAPALCNAIFAATGKRIRMLPIKDQLSSSVKKS